MCFSDKEYFSDICFWNLKFHGTLWTNFSQLTLTLNCYSAKVSSIFLSSFNLMIQNFFEIKQFIYIYIYLYIYIYIYIYIPVVCKKFCFNSGLLKIITSALSVSASRVSTHFLLMFLIRLNIFYEYLTENHAIY